MSDFWISTSAKAKSDWRIMLRDALKTRKKHFDTVKTRESKENEYRKDGCVPFSEVVDGAIRGRVFYSRGPWEAVRLPPGLKEKGTLSQDRERN